MLEHFEAMNWGEVVGSIAFYPPSLLQPGSVIWMFPKIGVRQNGWFIMENPLKMEDLGGFPIFLETPI